MTTAPAEALELQPVKGPSAFGGSVRRFAELLWIVSTTEFRLNYANTALGFLWTLIRPLIFFGVIFVVLREIFRFGRDIDFYPLILVLGLIFFQYFSETTARGVRSVSAKEGMVRKMQFPRIIIPLSVSLTAAFTMLLNLIAVMPIFFAFGVFPEVEWLLMIPVVLVLIGFSTGLAMLLSVAYVAFEDTQQIWSLISRIMFYASPILFPIDIVPESVRPIMAANPLSPLLEQARVWMIDPNAPTAVDAGGWLLGVAVPLGLIAVISVFSLWWFERRAPRVAEEL